MPQQLSEAELDARLFHHRKVDLAAERDLKQLRAVVRRVLQADLDVINGSAPDSVRLDAFDNAMQELFDEIDALEKRSTT